MLFILLLNSQNSPDLVIGTHSAKHKENITYSVWGNRKYISRTYVERRQKLCSNSTLILEKQTQWQLKNPCDSLVPIEGVVSGTQLFRHLWTTSLEKEQAADQSVCNPKGGACEQGELKWVKEQSLTAFLFPSWCIN